MDVTIQSAVIGAVAGIGGAGIGALAAWLAASKTNAIQSQLAESSAYLQREISDSNLAFQKSFAADNERAQRWSILEAQILKLSEFAIQYPTLEKEAYCIAYPNCPGDANGKERYENYCVYVFNVLCSVWEYCGRDRAKLRKLFVDEEVIRKHFRCWQTDNDNLDHDAEFRQYVQSVIDHLKKERRIT